jgi:two-component system, cell cycle sensor histidine kinase and response regulator CckA
LRALVIADEPFSRRQLTAALEGRGHSVAGVSTAEEGLEQHRETPFDLIVVDRTLPGMDGLDLCRTIRALPLGDEVVLLVVTDRVTPMDVEAVLEAGATDYLAKPLKAAQLCGRLLVVERQAQGGQAAQRLELVNATQAQLMLADRMASVGTLAAGVAHELNNPLAYVLANVRLLREELEALGDLLPEDRVHALRELVDESAHGIERMRHIVRDLKTFSRADDERHEVVEVEGVVRSCLNMCRNEIRHRAQLEVQIGQAPPVRINESRLAQVVLNLLINAAQAMPERPGAGARITVRVSTCQGAACIEVEDTGPGIDADRLGRIFHPFFTTKPPGEGTGLGLSICRNIVAAAGGEIDVQSSAGRGSRFTVRLPAAQGRGRRRSTSSPKLASISAAAAPRLLVIDDEPLVGRSLKRVLRDHDVTVVSNGQDAIHMLTSNGSNGFDLVLCDLMMPGVSGMEVYGAVVRERPELAERFVFMTGGAFSQGARDFLDGLSGEHIEKPFDPRLVRALVRERTQA